MPAPTLPINEQRETIRSTARTAAHAIQAMLDLREAITNGQINVVANDPSSIIGIDASTLTNMLNDLANFAGNYPGQLAALRAAK
jgi:hypothetical protein